MTLKTKMLVDVFKRVQPVAAKSFVRRQMKLTNAKQLKNITLVFLLH